MYDLQEMHMPVLGGGAWCLTGRTTTTHSPVRRFGILMR